MEIFVRNERLAYEARSDQVAALPNELAVGLFVEQHCARE